MSTSLRQCDISLFFIWMVLSVNNRIKLIIIVDKIEIFVEKLLFWPEHTLYEIPKTNNLLPAVHYSNSFRSG
jgi:hypothetical protein